MREHLVLGGFVGVLLILFSGLVFSVVGAKVCENNFRDLTREAIRQEIGYYPPVSDSILESIFNKNKYYKDCEGIAWKFGEKRKNEILKYIPQIKDEYIAKYNVLD